MCLYDHFTEYIINNKIPLALCIRKLRNFLKSKQISPKKAYIFSSLIIG